MKQVAVFVQQEPLSMILVYAKLVELNIVQIVKANKRNVHHALNLSF